MTAPEESARNDLDCSAIPRGFDMIMKAAGELNVVMKPQEMKCDMKLIQEIITWS